MGGGGNVVKGRQHSLNTMKDLQNQTEFESDWVYNTDKKKGMCYKVTLNHYF